MAVDDEKTDETGAEPLEEPRCPECLGELRSRNVATGKPAAPGDFLVCRHCGAMLEISEDGKPEYISPIMMHEIENEHPQVYRSMMAARKKILRSVEKRAKLAKPTVN